MYTVKILSIGDACQILKMKLLEDFIFVCIGSELRGDDRAALEFCRRLKSVRPSKIVLCEYGIENCIGELIESGARKIVILDAAIVKDLEPASIVLLNLDEVQDYTPFSTHTLPLPLLLRLLAEELKDVEMVVVGITVSKLDIDVEMSPQIENLVSTLASCVSE